MSTAGDTEGAAFDSGGVAIAYDDVGDGPPIVLVHGFASDRRRNWKEPGWYRTLAGAGRRVIGIDCRGHGESGKPGDPDAYPTGEMAADVVRLLDHLSIERADLMGYSMGGRIAARLLLDHPDRFNAVVLAGVGKSVVEGSGGRANIAEALEADDPEAITDPVGRRFREFAESRGNDLDALAAVQRAPRSGMDAGDFEGATLPVLVVAGGEDEMVGDPRRLAEAIPGAEAVVVPDRDHLTTVGDRAYKDAVLDFLDREGL